MAPVCIKTVLTVGVLCVCSTAQSPTFSPNHEEAPYGINAASNASVPTMFRFRVKPPPYAVERAGTVVVYQCLPELSVPQLSVRNATAEKLHLGVKVTWKTPEHVPHLNQSLDAWKEFQGHGYFINPDNNSLVLVDLAESDSGVYTCVMQHGHEVLEASMRLHVLYVPPYEFQERALYGLLAMALTVVFLGLMIGLKKVVLRYCWVERTGYRHAPYEMGEAEPSIQEM